MAAISPIESNQSGRSEVYVQPFPGPGRRELVSTDGGGQPAWARNGRELFYRAPGPGPTMRMMVVDVTLGDVFTAGRPRVLWEAMERGTQAERAAEPTTSRRMAGAS